MKGTTTHKVRRSLERKRALIDDDRECFSENSFRFNPRDNFLAFADKSSNLAFF